MKGKRFIDEQIACALRQAEGGAPVADVCRQLGVNKRPLPTPLGFSS
jgi:putative transposase